MVKDENSNSICRSNATSPIRENLERINPLTSGKKIPQKRTSTPLSIYSQNQVNTKLNKNLTLYRLQLEEEEVYILTELLQVKFPSSLVILVLREDDLMILFLIKNVRNFFLF